MATGDQTLDAALLARARRSLGRRDRILGAEIRRVGACRLESTGRPYQSLLRAILHQQLAGAAARAIEGRFKAAFGNRYPSHRALRDADPEALRGLGISGTKAETLIRIGAAFASCELSDASLRRASDDEVIERLTALKGVGVWTAQMILIFGLGRPDVLPTGDYGVKKGARVLYGLAELPGPAELGALGESWQPYRSVAAWYLWRAADASPRSKGSADG